MDLADSEHINISKSVYHAKYNSGNSNTYSFGSPQSTINNGATFANQSFAVNSSNNGANRDSAGSVYDYGGQRGY